MIFPVENFVGDSPADNDVWAIVKKSIPKESLSFHNYFLETKRPDVILLTPNRGVLIIETKGFLAKNIKSVPDSTVIKFYNSPAKGSPFNQAIEYRNKLIELMGQNSKIDPAFIGVAVCYPYITKEEYYDKKLNKISMEQMTIFKEDMVDENAFLTKIESIYEFIYDSMGMQFGQIMFEGEAMKKIAYLFAPEFDKDISDDDTEENIPKIRVRMDNYSKLITFQNHVTTETLTGLLDEWFSGEKLFLFFGKEDDYADFKGQLESRLALLGKNDYEAFKKIKENMINLVFSYVGDIGLNIEILNGEDYETYDDILTKLDEESIFNYQQYKVEHAETKDLVVRAGAGTGKTFSMLSRIHYLIWKHHYDAVELVEKIAMITFTREAAREMRDKLAGYFFDRYILTTDVVYLEYMEAVENMRISTIHSMAKEILKKYAVKLGLGTNFTVSGSTYEKKKRIHAALNKFILDSGEIDAGMQLYQLEKRIETFIDQIENKNIEITSEGVVDFGQEESIGTRIKFSDLFDTIREAKVNYREDCSNNNKIALSDMILQLEILADLVEPTEGVIDYLFIDEFQDTDDVQIKLVAKFKKRYGMKLFVVGDTKQCIYRFRGADDAAFVLLNTEIGVPAREIELKKNYRTDKLLLNRMNKVFSAWDAKGDIEYGPKDKLRGTQEYNTSDNYYKKVFTSDEERDELIINEIRKIQGRNPEDTIAVLVRTNFQALDFKGVCDSKGLRIVTSVGGNLYKIDPALDFLKLLHALKYNQRAKDIYGLYSTAYVSEKLDKIELDNLDENDKLAYFRDNRPKSLKKWELYIGRLRLEPVLKVVRDLIDDAKPWSIYASKLGGSEEEQNANKEYYLRNLDQIFENISLSTNSNYLTMNSLIEYLEIMVLTKQEEDEREGLIPDTKSNIPICTTVHKAKGLEYDHVFLPYCLYDVASTKTKGDVDIIFVGDKVGYSVKGEDFKAKPFVNDYYMTFKKTEYEDRRKEEIRILYVAMTRAIKSLVYYVDETEKEKKVLGNWKEMLKIGE